MAIVDDLRARRDSHDFPVKLKPREAAQVIGCSEYELRTAAKQGILHGVRTGGNRALHFTVEDLAAYLDTLNTRHQTGLTPGSYRALQRRQSQAATPA